MPGPNNLHGKAQLMDRGSFIIASVTLVLFVAALFAKGITHDLFLEAGIFLVSAKLILMNYKNSLAVKLIHEKLDAILETLRQETGGDH